jgi:type 1 glutamine amidotransferase
MFPRADWAFLARIVVACCLLAGGSGRAAADGPLRALIVTGEGNPGWRETTPLLRRILSDSGRFDVRVCELPGGLNGKSLEGFDLLIDHGAGLTPGGEAEGAVATFLGSGKGLLVTRGALGAPSVPGFWPMRVAGEVAPQVGFLDVTIPERGHPIVAGMSAEFRTADSVPTGLEVGPDAEILATALEPGANGPGRPVLAVSRAGEGRVASLALGHDPSAIHEPRFAPLFARAGEWAATGAITLPAEPRPSRPAPGAVRGLVITGGHDHEAAFYSLFDGHDDLDWLPVDTGANAFQKDLRDRYDVVILYDFTRELDELGKKNLRDFVEAGKGVVVLHHALLNFQTWGWWSEEVVGGRYRLQREGESPSSSVKDDQEIFASPASTHPVLAGIAPFHITDEAYKNLFMSPRITPLLTTDNPTSDVNLAWIGPCRTSRVVAIQLGHGHSAFGHPSYRTLVHNAILWAAGKSE